MSDSSSSSVTSPVKAAPPKTTPAQAVSTQSDVPTGSLKGVAKDTAVKTACPYCGVGCGLEVLPPPEDSNKGPKVRGDRDHPSSQGMVCVKGATILESLDKDRLLHPMMRDSLDDEFRQVSWDEALDAIVSRMRSTLETLGPKGICMYGSGQFLTEDYYVAQKLMKGFLRTNNFDANSRLCMSSAVAAYKQSFGSDGPPSCYDDLELTDCLFAIGTNTADCHPIIFNRFRKVHKTNPDVKLVVVDPRKTATAKVADLHLAIRPGSDVDLLYGMGHLLLKWGAIAPDYIAQHTVGFEAFRDRVQEYPPDLVATRCGISQEELEQAARYWGNSQRVLSLWSMGVNQSSEGTVKARSIINLHLMTGQIGQPGTGPFSLTGQPNAMGGREAGGLANLLPGYRDVANGVHRKAVEEFWGRPAGSIDDQAGLTAWKMVEALEQDQVGILWIAATNPAVSFPSLDRAKAAFQRSPFTVHQDAYYPTETAAYAHLLLPAAQWGEKSGTMTNSERFVTYMPVFREAPGEARPDWAIFAEVGRRLGFGDAFAFQDAAAVHREFVQITAGRPCDSTGLSHKRLAEQPLQWPFPATPPEGQGGSNGLNGSGLNSNGANGSGANGNGANGNGANGNGANGNGDSNGVDAHGAGDRLPNPLESSGTKRLYTDGQFNTPDGRARFCSAASTGLAEPTTEDFPYIFTTGRLYGHWHTQTRTGRIPRIGKMHPEARLEIHPSDAENLGIGDGDWVAVKSRRGQGRFRAKVTEAIAQGTVFAPMHWGALWANQAEVNALTHSEVCPSSKQPELKACAVHLAIDTAPE